jgi:hypothetical protein
MTVRHFLRSVMTTLTYFLLHHNPKWRRTDFQLRYALLYPGVNSRAELLPSPRANAPLFIQLSGTALLKNQITHILVDRLSCVNIF